MGKHETLAHSLFTRRVTRRDFVKWLAAGLGSIPVLGFMTRVSRAAVPESYGRKKRVYSTKYDLVETSGTDIYNMTVRNIEALGGMSTFIDKGDVVVVKPNIGWDRNPAQGANTHPEVVSALVDMCYKSGASRVKVFDVTCNNPKRCYVNSGIQAAAVKSGAEVFIPDDWNVVAANFRYPSDMQGWHVLRDAVECDKFINVPVLKHHGLAGLTLSMKNLMGICVGNRGLIHFDIGRKLVDLTDYIAPDLTVIDATRYLRRNGPSGGSLDDVVRTDKVLSSTDPTLADAFAARMVGVDPMSLSYISDAVKRGFGSADIDNAKVFSMAV